MTASTERQVGALLIGNRMELALILTLALTFALAQTRSFNFKVTDTPARARLCHFFPRSRAFARQEVSGLNANARAQASKNDRALETGRALEMGRALVRILQGSHFAAWGLRGV